MIELWVLLAYFASRGRIRSEVHVGGRAYCAVRAGVRVWPVLIFPGFSRDSFLFLGSRLFLFASQPVTLARNRYDLGL
jgi:hypothetical protein